MALPVITVPEFKLTIPSTGKKIKFRPFLVKEQKILLMAREGDDQQDVIDAVKKILEDCILTDDVDINKLATFDVEYLFLNLRAKSIGEVVELKLRHREGDCKNETEVMVNLEEVKIKKDKKHENPIQLTDTVGVEMIYPNFETVTTLREAKSDIDTTFETIGRCVKLVYDGDNVYDSFTPDEMTEWIERLSKDQFEKINNFFVTMPKLEHTIEYTCPKCKQTEKVKIEGLQSFFT